MGLTDDFEAALGTLAKHLVWSVLPGGPQTARFSFDLGDKLPLNPPLRNERLRADERFYEGEMSMLVECAWQFSDGHGARCGSGDAAVGDPAAFTERLRGMQDRTVASCRTIGGAYVLLFTFDNGAQLVICPDVFTGHAGIQNYSLRVGDDFFVVDGEGQLSFYRRKRSNEPRLKLL